MSGRITGAAALIAAVALAGCGSQSTPGSPPVTSTPAQVDPCTLLTDADAAAHLKSEVTHGRDDVPGVGPGCTWKAKRGDASVYVLLKQPPFPDRDVQRARRTLDFAGKPGYVQADDGKYCLIYVNAGPTWVQFSSRSAPTDPVPKNYECDRSVPVLEGIVRKLG